MTDRELDALVAEAISPAGVLPRLRHREMNLNAIIAHGVVASVHCVSCGESAKAVERLEEFCRHHVPARYSTDIGAAFDVVEAMRAKGWDFRLDYNNGPLPELGDRYEYCAAFWNNEQHEDASISGDVTASKAIVLAALRALGVEVSA